MNGPKELAREGRSAATTTTPRIEVVPAEARGIQGHRAGLISRTVANVVDLLLVFVVVAATYIGWAGVKLLWQGQRSHAARAGVRPRVRVLHARAHRVFHGVVGDIRPHVRRPVDGAGREPRGRTLGLGLAAIRAVLCVAFPVGLLWVGISREHRSVQDLILRTSVIHDWLTYHTEPPADDDSDDPLSSRVDVQPPVADEPHDGHAEPLSRLDGE